MTNTELYETLLALVGQRVKINTASRLDDQFMMLDKVTITPEGSVWVHNSEKGIAARVSSEGFELEVEEIQGTFDNASEDERAAMIRRIKFVYGNSGADDSKRCLCSSCRERHETNEKVRHARLVGLGYGKTLVTPTPEEIKTYGSGGPAPDVSRGPDNPFSDL